jgi:hypothetical protein
MQPRPSAEADCILSEPSCAQAHRPMHQCTVKRAMAPRSQSAFQDTRNRMHFCEQTRRVLLKFYFENKLLLSLSNCCSVLLALCARRFATFSAILSSVSVGCVTCGWLGTSVVRGGNVDGPLDGLSLLSVVIITLLTTWMPDPSIEDVRAPFRAVNLFAPGAEPRQKSSVLGNQLSHARPQSSATDHDPSTLRPIPRYRVQFRSNL